MKLRNVRIERKGQRGPLSLENLSPGLNIVFGPSGSGKSTVFRSIQNALLQRLRYDRGGSSVDDGVAHLDVVEDASPSGRLGAESRNWYAPLDRGHDLSPFRAVTETELRHIFTVQGVPTPWQTLVRQVEALGALPRGTAESQWPREQELEHRIRDCRSRLAAFPASQAYGSHLAEERRQAEQHLLQLKESRTRDWDLRDREIRAARGEREHLAQRLERLQGLLDRIKERRQRRLELADEAPVVRAPHGPAMYYAPSDTYGRSGDRPTDVNTLDSACLSRQLSNWEKLYARLRDEITTLHNSLREFPESPDRSPLLHADRLAYLLRSVDLEVDDLESRQGVSESAEFFDGDSDRPTVPDGATSSSSLARETTQNLRTLVDAMFANMREELPSLYRARDDRYVWHDPRATRLAVDYLERSAAELRALLDHFRTIPAEAAWPYPGTTPDHRPWRYRSDNRPDNRSAVRSPSYTSIRQMHLDAAQRLAARQETLLKEQERIERALHQLRKEDDNSWRNHGLDEEIRLTEQRLAALERDLTNSTERDRLLRALESLEHELAELRNRVGDGHILRQASQWLQRLSRGALGNITYDLRGEFYAEEAYGSKVPLRDLRPDGRALTELCLQLAIASAFRQRGQSLPLLIEDLPHFALLHEAELAHVLHELACDGQQIVLFTADRELAQQLERYPAHTYSLVRRTFTERVGWPEPSSSSQDHHASYARPSEHRPSEHRPSEHRPGHHRPGEHYATENRPTDYRSPGWPWPRRDDDKRTTIPISDPRIASAIPAYSAASTAGPVTPTGSNGQRNHADVRYYLHLRDHVVDAPSIGPKSADRLNRMGIRTVIDLLQADANQVARQFDHRQVSPDVVRDWQDQARLVCQIPYLRAHDAQLLVACDVRTPHKLATHDAQSLWRQVDHYADSTEGRRVLRQGPKPDLAEVQHWIQWARDARALDAA